MSLADLRLYNVTAEYLKEVTGFAGGIFDWDHHLFTAFKCSHYELPTEDGEPGNNHRGPSFAGASIQTTLMGFESSPLKFLWI